MASAYTCDLVSFSQYPSEGWSQIWSWLISNSASALKSKSQTISKVDWTPPNWSKHLWRRESLLAFATNFLSQLGSLVWTIDPFTQCGGCLTRRPSSKQMHFDLSPLQTPPTRAERPQIANWRSPLLLIWCVELIPAARLATRYHSRGFILAASSAHHAIVLPTFSATAAASPCGSPS